MEQHPVPQNITGFQFKLIGDMTIRQFLFLAGGILLGYLVYQIQLPSLFRWFLAFCFASLGFGFAFVPVEERPLDRWLLSFIQRVYSPTQFLWKKRALPLEILTNPVLTTTAFQTTLLKKDQTDAQINEYLRTLPVNALTSEIDKKENNLLAQLGSLMVNPLAIPIPTTPMVPLIITAASEPTLPPLSDLDLEKKGGELLDKIVTLQNQLGSQTIGREKFIEIQAQLAFLLKEKERLTKQLVEMKKTLNKKQAEDVVRPITIKEFNDEPTVRAVSGDMASKIGLPRAPSTPNTPSGVVKNQRGAILPGVLLEIRNQLGTPLRALRTGKLGQFTVTTPLANGIYTIHLEDPQKTYFFDVIEITLKGELVPSLEISAKTQRDKQKEELAKKLFGPNLL